MDWFRSIHCRPLAGRPDSPCQADTLPTILAMLFLRLFRGSTVCQFAGRAGIVRPGGWCGSGRQLIRPT